MRFVENNQIEKARTKLIESEIHRLPSRDEEALSRVDVVGVNAIARLVREMCLETVG